MEPRGGLEGGASSRSSDSKRERLACMYEDDSYCDCTVFVGNVADDSSLAASCERFRVNRTLLARCSDVFGKMLFEQKMREQGEGEVRIKDCSPAAFRQLMRCSYDLTPEIREDTFADIFQLAKKYEVEELIQATRLWMGSTLTCPRDSLRALDAAHDLLDARVEDELVDFLEHCLQTVSRNGEVLLAEEELLASCSLPTISRLLRQESFKCEEERLWRALVLWAERQPTSPPGSPSLRSSSGSTCCPSPVRAQSTAAATAAFFPAATTVSSSSNRCVATATTSDGCHEELATEDGLERVFPSRGRGQAGLRIGVGVSPGDGSSLRLLSPRPPSPPPPPPKSAAPRTPTSVAPPAATAVKSSRGAALSATARGLLRLLAPVLRFNVMSPEFFVDQVIPTGVLHSDEVVELLAARATRRSTARFPSADVPRCGIIGAVWENTRAMQESFECANGSHTVIRNNYPHWKRVLGRWNCDDIMRGFFGHGGLAVKATFSICIEQLITQRGNYEGDIHVGVAEPHVPSDDRSDSRDGSVKAWVYRCRDGALLGPHQVLPHRFPPSSDGDLLRFELHGSKLFLYKKDILLGLAFDNIPWPVVPVAEMNLFGSRVTLC